MAQGKNLNFQTNTPKEDGGATGYGLRGMEWPVHSQTYYFD